MQETKVCANNNCHNNVLTGPKITDSQKGKSIIFIFIFKLVFF